MTKSIKTDVVVAGAGGTGLAAAYAAAEHGLQVLVLEKQSQIGGNTKISSGFFAVDSKEQRERGMVMSKAEAIRQLTSYNHNISNGPLVHKIVNTAADTLAWIQKMGMHIKLNATADTTQFAHRNRDYQGGVYHMYQDKDGSYERIQQTLIDEGVKFEFNVTMQSIEQDSTGQVIGITATDANGEIIEVEAQATIVATGGFGGDSDLVAKTMHTRNLRQLGVPNNGEGLKALVAAGGINIDGTALIHAAQLAKSKVTKKSSKEHLAGFSNSALTQLLLTPLFWVSPKGERFTNEDVVYDTVEWANAGYSVGGKYYFVVDQATLDDFTENGGQLEVSKAGPGANTEPGDFTKLANDSVAAGTAFKGNSLAELATAAGMDSNTLVQAVTAYNHNVHNRVDTDFAKSGQSLVYAVEQGPFYAFTAQVAYLGTVGGVRVDTNLNVLDDKFKPIPGLYTGGANAGGYYQGHCYPAYEGLASGFTWTSGRIAGTSASEYIKIKNDKLIKK
ncbi:FAD-dependent oxidoreductase [Liquorilactobacillus mali]|uniref:Fumarate reductase succinate dehydrogenase flavoprotein domain protein n=1 Tax=Liquorilactobacillus mali KCTC 3596 = DSM 20444 TaxID=1046596 RepID=J1F008_9LACO|nr:FAD-dependent oxidoreductase [Liquorilactobacillus mali]EJE97278.1 fumarate reductase/succinate dehydrogenase flavoprotein domain protein [Liquorilactobacillus mali KCTC 3596 = DSM 20444]KRN11335.1 fumarate reductase succinate dehydrogenase flavoprotein domain protein [Liquorilactobacillus mali KCTC 3596 = DSM 20444]MDC7953160.1 FAD-dependent oxidoreductase [Liquorilactobacillus mali]MDV7757247.1 FAD-dependent oxidoreductase [Liquorilactobacillus mali]